MVAFAAGAVLTAANLNASLNQLTIRAVTTTSDTLVLADQGGAVSYSNASPITATVPPFSSVAYANGTVIQLLNLGAGVVTVTAGAGVTVNGSVLTLAQNTGGTLIKTATNTWYFLPSASAGAGMDLITPTSVAGSGVTLSGGQVSFSAATEISINGCFTSAYANYAWVVNFSAVSASDPEITVRMRASGANETGANYASQRLSQKSTTVVGIADTVANTSMSLLHGSTGAASAAGDGMFLDPQNAAYTRARATSWYFGSDSQLYQQLNIALLKNTTAYDGFSIIPQSGNVSGTLRIYGLRNS